VSGFPSDAAKLHDYEAFIAIVEAGNLTRAAGRVRRSLQSVSRSLAALEQQLGVVLVRRTTRSAQPTEAGMTLYRRVGPALREIGTAEAELRDASGTLRGALKIAGSAFFVGGYVVPAIREFSQQHPGVKFDLRISERFTEHVESGVDLMIRIGQLPPSPLKARKLASLRRVAIASPGYLAQRGRPEAPADLARHTCIIRTSAQDARDWTFQGADGTSHRVRVDGAFVSDSAFVTLQAVLAGMGIAVVYFFQMREAIESGRAEVVLDDFTLPASPVHAVLPSNERTPARVRRFVDLLAQRLKKEIV
jgi:DNA-binding transcriptional LysR family regulator